MIHTWRDSRHIKLSADLCDALLNLMATQGKWVDAVEIGPWFTVDQIRAYRQLMPGIPFYFHAADMVEMFGNPSTAAQQVADYLDCTRSPWASVHISVWEPGDILQILNGQRLPLPSEDRAAQNFIRKVKNFERIAQVPVLIENVEPLTFEGYDFWTQPDFICRVLEQTGCGFLLDTGHARISAESLGMDIDTYLHLLPLERVVQVHVSGPRSVEGRLRDTHQSLQEEDYDLLHFILTKTHPQLITLEYILEEGKLREQLARLRNLLD